MFFERFPYSEEEILRLLAQVLGTAERDLILVALNRRRREEALVDGCARLQVSEGGSAALTLLRVTPDDGSPGEPEWEPADEDEEPDEALFENKRSFQPCAIICLPVDLMSRSFPYPMVLETNRACDGVTVLFGDGGFAANIVYINSGEEPVRVDGEKLMPGECIRVRSPGCLKVTDARSGPERMREKRKKRRGPHLRAPLRCQIAHGRVPEGNSQVPRLHRVAGALQHSNVVHQ